jgi:hypothetical protein
VHEPQLRVGEVVLGRVRRRCGHRRRAVFRRGTGRARLVQLRQQGADGRSPHLPLRSGALAASGAGRSTAPGGPAAPRVALASWRRASRLPQVDHVRGQFVAAAQAGPGVLPLVVGAGVPQLLQDRGLDRSRPCFMRPSLMMLCLLALALTWVPWMAGAPSWSGPSVAPAARSG